MGSTNEGTVAVLAFRNPDGGLGFAQTFDPLTYAVRVQLGTSETRWVKAGAKLEWMALTPDRFRAAKFRDWLNELGSEEAEIEIRRRAIPTAVVEEARALVDRHIRTSDSDEASKKDQQALSEQVAQTLGEALGEATPNQPAPLQTSDARVECRWPHRLVIFDLDGTLADTSAFDGPVRRAHGGRLDEIRLFGVPGQLGMHDLPAILASERRVVVVTASPRGYAQDVLHHIGVEPDELHTAVGLEKDGVFQRAMDEACCAPSETLVIGDRWTDWRAAAGLGIVSLGGFRFGANLSEEAPDVSFGALEDVIASERPQSLGYIGEVEDPAAAQWHDGRVLKVAPDSWALGRYFPSRTLREIRRPSPLSEGILRAKGGTVPTELSAAVRRVCERMADSQRMAISHIVSIPPKSSQLDRFATLRSLAAGTLKADELAGSDGLTDLAPERGSQSEKSFDERQRSQADRYAFRSSSVIGARVLLLDDVRTTGGTLAGAQRAIRDAGAERVYSLVWGQTQAWYPQAKRP